MINDQGGVNGRKINFVSVENGSGVKKTVELARKLVEQDQVLLIFSSFGTGPNSAIRTYMNEKKVPHLLGASGAATFDDPQNFPWTMGFHATFGTEGSVYAK